MTENLEIEFKTELSKQKYAELLAKYANISEQFAQINYYFDDFAMKLTKNKQTARIRHILDKDVYELTVKFPDKNGTLEKTEILSESQAKKFIKKGFKFKFDTIIFLSNKGKLKTKRVEFKYKTGTGFLDFSTWGFLNLNKVYEFEFEALSLKKGKSEFDEFLKENEIEYKKSQSKGSRILKLNEDKK